MATLTIQLDLRLRRMTTDGLDDCVGTFTHYDLPLDAAGNDWTENERWLVEGRVEDHLHDFIRTCLPGLMDHCAYEQQELPFG